MQPTQPNRHLDFLEEFDLLSLHPPDHPTNESIPAEFMQAEINLASLHFNNVTWVTR